MFVICKLFEAAALKVRTASVESYSSSGLVRFEPFVSPFLSLKQLSELFILKCNYCVPKLR